MKIITSLTETIMKECNWWAHQKMDKIVFDVQFVFLFPHDLF